MLLTACPTLQQASTDVVVSEVRRAGCVLNATMHQPFSIFEEQRQPASPGRQLVFHTSDGWLDISDGSTEATEGVVDVRSYEELCKVLGWVEEEEEAKRLARPVWGNTGRWATAGGKSRDRSAVYRAHNKTDDRDAEAARWAIE